MKSFIIFLATIVFYINYCVAQTLSPSVIASSGGLYESANSSLSFTTAEMTAIQTYSSINNILTQGFQQPEDTMIVSISEIPANPYEVFIYPNPVSNGYFIVSYNIKNDFSVKIRIFNAAGQLVMKRDDTQTYNQTATIIDVKNLCQGIYIIECSISDNSGMKIPIYQKINIIN